MNYIKSLTKQLGPKVPKPPLNAPHKPAELASIYVQLDAADASFATGQVYGSAAGTGQP